MSVYERPHEHGVTGKEGKGQGQPAPVVADDDDWETDSNYVNDVSEVQQRYGSKLIQPLKADALLDGDTPSLQAMKERTERNNDAAVNQEYQQKRTLYGGK
eukprot:TRINITY_DN3666_c0_g1_i1.p1 TRINITY_DN3666_c0_g1~~TRINITY_DN3666_c0_g1_i1.p1  ORF type:complete len:101 (-),score=35.57 TRINITY_DN3666_c0_g1_i1:97-399(-)